MRCGEPRIPSHSNLETSLKFIEKIRPRRPISPISLTSWVTLRLENELPANVHMAYDGLRIPFEL